MRAVPGPPGAQQKAGDQGGDRFAQIDQRRGLPHHAEMVRKKTWRERVFGKKKRRRDTGRGTRDKKA